MTEIAISPAINLESINGNSTLKTQPNKPEGVSFQKLLTSISESTNSASQPNVSLETPQQEPKGHNNSFSPLLMLESLVSDEVPDGLKSLLQETEDSENDADINLEMISQMMVCLNNQNSDMTIIDNSNHQLEMISQTQSTEITTQFNSLLATVTLEPNNTNKQIFQNDGNESETMLSDVKLANVAPEFTENIRLQQTADLVKPNLELPLDSAQKNDRGTSNLASVVFSVQQDSFNLKPLKVPLTNPFQPNLINLTNINKSVANDLNFGTRSIDESFESTINELFITGADNISKDSKVSIDSVGRFSTAISEEIIENLNLEGLIPTEETGLKNIDGLDSNLTLKLPEPVQKQFTTLMPQIEESAGKSIVSKDEIFTQIVEKAKVMVNQGNSEMEINLKPDSLGKMQLKISLENHLVTARFVAESDQVKQILESNLVELRKSLQEQGIQVQNMMVSVDQNGTGNGNLNQHSALYQRGFHFKNESDASTLEAACEPVTEVRRIFNHSSIDLIA